MAKLPELPADSQTVTAIYAGYVAREKPRRSRRLGASIVGKECARAVWYDFRWCGQEAFDGRMLKLFARGQVEEVRFVMELRSISCPPFNLKEQGLSKDDKMHDQVVVLDKDQSTGEQFEYTAASGHVVCKIDAAVLGLPEAPKAWHAAEFKTHSNKSFGEVSRKGLKAGKPQHYAQVLIGMALSGMKRGLYLAVNKDNDTLYSERVRWEDVKDDAAAAIAHAESIVTAAIPPEKIKDDPDYYVCRFCFHRDRCHGSGVADVTCRSCVHATPVIETDGAGRWTCAKHGDKTLAQAEQERACPDHLYIPSLIPYAEAVDGGGDPAGDWVEYRMPDGRTWRNGKQKGHYRSVELVQLPPEQVGGGEVDQVKQLLGGVVTEFQPATETPTAVTPPKPVKLADGDRRWMKEQAARAGHKFEVWGDDLKSCTVCGGVEGSLPTHCPKVLMTSLNPDLPDRVYAGEVDYRFGRWTNQPTMAMGHVYGLWRNPPRAVDVTAGTTAKGDA